VPSSSRKLPTTRCCAEAENSIRPYWIERVAQGAVLTPLPSSAPILPAMARKPRRRPARALKRQVYATATIQGHSPCQGRWQCDTPASLDRLF
jgi:hypothetical protein